MDYKKINEILSDLTETKLERKYKKITEIHNNYGKELDMGEEGSKITIYQVDADTYIKVSYFSNSYGEEQEGVRSIQFVKPVQKTITDFEELK